MKVMTSYQFRISMEDVKRNNPGEQIEDLQNLLEKLASFGYSNFSCSLGNIILQKDENLYEEWKHVLETKEQGGRLSSEKRFELKKEFLTDKNKWFFIEARGPQWFRGEGESYEACAQSILHQYEHTETCQHTSWTYNGDYGSKSCSCGKHEKATLEELRKNCEKWKYDLNDNQTLQYDKNQEICPHCRSHEMIRHDTIFPEERFVCAACKNIIPIEQALYDERRTRFTESLPKDYKEAVKEEYIFHYGSKHNQKQLDELLKKFFQSLFYHAKEVKQMDKLGDISKWMKPYVDFFIEDAKLIFEDEHGEQSVILNVDFHIKQEETVGFGYEMQVKKKEENAEYPEEKLKNGMMKLFDAMTKK